MSEFVLYNYFRSSPSYRVRIAMHLKNLKFKYHPVHLLNNGGEQYGAEYRKLNPSAEVPSLVHGDYILSQSMAIFEYLDTIKPTPRLFPVDPQQAGKVRQFCEVINSGMHPYGNLKTTVYLDKKLHIPEAQRTEWLHNFFHKGFASLEKMLEKSAGTYCFGGEVTAADCFLIPMIFSGKRFKITYENYPIIQRVAANCENQEAFKVAHPFRQIDTPAELKIK